MIKTVCILYSIGQSSRMFRFYTLMWTVSLPQEECNSLICILGYLEYNPIRLNHLGRFFCDSHVLYPEAVPYNPTCMTVTYILCIIDASHSSKSFKAKYKLQDFLDLRRFSAYCTINPPTKLLCLSPFYKQLSKRQFPGYPSAAETERGSQVMREKLIGCGCNC